MFFNIFLKKISNIKMSEWSYREDREILYAPKIDLVQNKYGFYSWDILIHVFSICVHEATK